MLRLLAHPGAQTWSVWSSERARAGRRIRQERTLSIRSKWAGLVLNAGKANSLLNVRH